MADLVSVDTVHFLLHGRTGLQHRKKNFNSCIQRAVIWCHCNYTENNCRPSNIQETSGCTLWGEHTYTCREEITDSCMCLQESTRTQIKFQFNFSFTKMSNHGSTYGARWTTKVLADVSSEENRGGVIPRCYPHLQLETIIATL